jgi:hypothetical protein
MSKNNNIIICFFINNLCFINLNLYLRYMWYYKKIKIEKYYTRLLKIFINKKRRISIKLSTFSRRIPKKKIIIIIKNIHTNTNQHTCMPGNPMGMSIHNAVSIYYSMNSKAGEKKMSHQHQPLNYLVCLWLKK